MAEYPTLAPTLAAMDAARTNPLDSEAASKWPVVDRQTRDWLFTFLSQYFDGTTGKLKPFAYGDGTVPTGTVHGTNPASNAQREIVQGSILGVDVAQNTLDTGNFKTNCITDALVDVEALTGTKIKIGSLPGNRLQDGSLPGAKMAARSLVSGQFVLGTLIEEVFATNCVSVRMLQARCVTPSKLPLTNEGFLLVGGNTDADGTVNCAVPKQISGAFTVNKDGVATLNANASAAAIAFARIVEKTGNGAGAGTSNLAPVGGATTGLWGYSTTTPWQARGMAAPWSIVTDPGSIIQRIELVTTSQDIKDNAGVTKTFYFYQKRVYIAKSGTYLLQLSVPGYGVGNHCARVVALANPTAPGALSFVYGSTEQVSGASQSHSSLSALLTFSDAVANAYPYFYVEWLCDNPAVTNGMGYPSTLPNSEGYYAQINLLRLA